MAFDGGNQYGLGNVKRAVTLGQCVEKRGHNLIMVPLSEEAAKLSGFARSRSLDFPWDAGIVDVPYSVRRIIQSLPVRENLVLALDQTVPGEFTAVNSSISPPPQTKKSLLGLKYVPIRGDLVGRENKVAAGDTCLVSIGGGDIDGLAEKVCRELLEHWPGPITLIEGPNSIRKIGPLPGVDIIQNPMNFSELLSLAACVVTTGGMTFLETLYLQKPVFVIPRTIAEEEFLETLPRDSLILGSGLENLDRITTNALQSFHIRSSNRDLVDGRGGDRIIDFLISLIEERELHGY